LTSFDKLGISAGFFVLSSTPVALAKAGTCIRHEQAPASARATVKVGTRLEMHALPSGNPITPATSIRPRGTLPRSAPSSRISIIGQPWRRGFAYPASDTMMIDQHVAVASPRGQGS
jgi:hypothetical protein